MLPAEGRQPVVLLSSAGLGWLGRCFPCLSHCASPVPCVSLVPHISGLQARAQLSCSPGDVCALRGEGLGEARGGPADLH